MRFDPAVLVALPVCVLSVVVHECAHGLAALWRGDATARERGRLTLDPRPHLDPVGTLLVPAALLLLHAPVPFAWGRPAPVDHARLRRPHDDGVTVALAGPAASFLLAIGFAAVARVAPESGFWAPLAIMARAGVVWNCAIGLVNLIPVPPLDGSWALMRVLPLRHIIALRRFRRFGLALVALVLVSPAGAGTAAHGPLGFAVRACLDLFGAGPAGGAL